MIIEFKIISLRVSSNKNENSHYLTTLMSYLKPIRPLFIRKYFLHLTLSANSPLCLEAIYTNSTHQRVVGLDNISKDTS